MATASAEDDVADVIVVGAGLSGLSAALRIRKQSPGSKVIVLEAKPRVGGRTLTSQLRTVGGTAAWDLGGQWVARSQTRILALMEELGVNTHAQYTQGKKLQQIGDSISSYQGAIPALNPLALVEMHFMLGKLNKMAASIDVSAPYEHAQAAEWDRTTVDEYVRRRVWTSSVREALEAGCRVTFGAETSQMSMLYFLTYGGAAGGFNALFENAHDGGQEFTIAGGAQQLSVAMATRVGDVRLSRPVVAVSQTEDAVVVATEGGGRLRAARVVLAIPPHQAALLAWSPPLPLPRRSLLERLPVSHLTKFVATYASAFWRQRGFSGEILSSGSGAPCGSGCDSAPVSYACDHTDADGNAALVGFLGGKNAVQWSTRPADERRDAVLRHLAAFLGDEALSPLEFAEKQWHEEPYNGGCPTNVAPPGAMRYYAEALRAPLGRVHVAGTESATRWCGFMDGAVEAGQRAAEEVLSHLRPDSLAAESDATCRPEPKM